MIAHCLNMQTGEFVHTFGDMHIYLNQLEGVKKQLERPPKELPKLRINPECRDLFEFKVEDFILEGYDPDSFIKYEVAV